MKINIAHFTVRPFESTDLDYAAAVKFFNQNWPNNPATIEIWKDRDSKRNPKYLNRRYIGEIRTENGKQIVAVGFVNNRNLMEEPGKYFIKFYIDKEFKDQGFVEPLYTHMVADLADKNPVALKTEIREDNVSLIKLFQQRGFQDNRRPKRYSELDVSNFDFDPFARYSEKVASSGIKIVNVQKLETSDSNWMQKLYDLETTIEKEIRNTNEYKHMELKEYAKMFKEVNFLAEAHFVAVDGDNYVGISSLWPDPVREDLLYIGTTRILLSHRRLGIATALKLKTIAFAQAYGANAIQTRNVKNSPMFTLNRRLGFKPGLTLLFFDKVL